MERPWGSGLGTLGFSPKTLGKSLNLSAFSPSKCEGWEILSGNVIQPHAQVIL